MTALNSGEIDVRTVDQPLGTGERYTVTDVALGLGYGRRITSRFAAGIQVNYVNERIWHTSNRMLTFNLGTVYRLTEGGGDARLLPVEPRHAGALQGGDLAIQYDADPDDLRRQQRAAGRAVHRRVPGAGPLPGRAERALPDRVDDQPASCSWSRRCIPTTTARASTSAPSGPGRTLFALRAGYQTLFQDDRELGLTLGVGVAGDLAEQPLPVRLRLGRPRPPADTHRLTLVLVF